MSEDQGQGPRQARIEDLPLWQSHKVVRAAKIRQIEHQEDGSCILSLLMPSDGPLMGLMSFPVDRAYVEKHEPQADGYLVIYEDGYKSWSPAVAFEGGYHGFVAAEDADTPAAPARLPSAALITMRPTIGRIVHYRLTREDAESISHRRRSYLHQHFRGNDVREADIVAMTVTRDGITLAPDDAFDRAALAGELGPGAAYAAAAPRFEINAQAWLDGNDTFWVTSAKGPGTKLGEWSWPPRV